MNPVIIIKIIMAFTLVAITTYTDIKERKIKNKHTVPFALAGIILNATQDFPNGLKMAGLGFVVGFVVFLLPYIMGAMGAGDIKLMAAIGAILGFPVILYVTVATALTGGIIIIVGSIKNGRMGQVLKRMGKLILFYLFSVLYKIVNHPKLNALKESNRIEMTDEAVDFIPYGVAIAGGVIITVGLALFNVIEDLHF